MNRKTMLMAGALLAIAALPDMQLPPVRVEYPPKKPNPRTKVKAARKQRIKK